jgi:putative Holliday junction resolvase
MRHGRRLGIDAGKARVGVAVCDPSGLLATPVATLQRADVDLLTKLGSYAAEFDAIEIVVGLPLNLSGAYTPSTEDALSLAREIADAVEIPVVMIDERLTTVSAHAALRETGKKQRGTRSVIDQVAAVMVLQHSLDSERASGVPVGKPLADC